MIEKLQEFIDNLRETEEIKNSREKSLTITKLEEAMFWLTYAIDNQNEKIGVDINVFKRFRRKS